MQIPESDADWRLATVARVKGDQLIFGNLVKDQTLLWLTTVTEVGHHGEVSFPTPGPAALAFSVAFEAARAAIAMKPQITFVGRSVSGKSIETASIPALFAYFEQAMSAAVFSFQCLEAFANRVISDTVKSPMAEIIRCSRLRQSILKWAFEGRLVDQNPSDEPASVLLDRIRAERAADGGVASARRRSRSSQRSPSARIL